MTLYDKLKREGCEIDHHESDLYVRATPQARAIVADWQRHVQWGAKPTFFRSFNGRRVQSCGEVWIEVPFAYSPWLDARRPVTP